MSTMTPRERFLAVVRNEPVDYVPIFGFGGAPGMSLGCMKHTHDNLIATGMPEDIGGCMDNWSLRDAEGWQRYWGTTTCANVDFGLAGGAQWFKNDVRVEDGYEIHERIRLTFRYLSILVQVPLKDPALLSILHSRGA